MQHRKFCSVPLPFLTTLLVLCDTDVRSFSLPFCIPAMLFYIVNSYLRFVCEITLIWSHRSWEGRPTGSDDNFRVMRHVQQRVVGIESGAEFVISSELMTVMMMTKHRVTRDVKLMLHADHLALALQTPKATVGSKSRGPRSLVGHTITGNCTLHRLYRTQQRHSELLGACLFMSFVHRYVLRQRHA